VLAWSCIWSATRSIGIRGAVEDPAHQLPDSGHDGIQVVRACGEQINGLADLGVAVAQVSKGRLGLPTEVEAPPPRSMLPTAGANTSAGFGVRLDSGIVAGGDSVAWLPVGAIGSWSTAVSPGASPSSISGALYPLHLVRTLDAPPGLVGVLLAVEGVGSLLGAVLTPRLTTWLGSARALLLSGVPSVAGAVLVPLGSGWVGYLAFAVGSAVFAAVVCASLALLLFSIRYLRDLTDHRSSAQSSSARPKLRSAPNRCSVGRRGATTA